jgi:hypothetical protein
MRNDKRRSISPVSRMLNVLLADGYFPENGERSRDGGKTWDLEAEFFLERD